MSVRQTGTGFSILFHGGLLVASDRPLTRAFQIGFTALFLLVPLLATVVAADGVPAVSKFKFDDDPEVFESIFESRQLAQIEMVNDTHERIHLFLSVYSLDPGENLSVIVPLRTLPEDISGRPMQETEFREEFRINKAEQLVVEQDPDEAWGKVGYHTQKYCVAAMGSLLWTLPGEYVRQNVVASEGAWSEGLLMGGMIATSDDSYDIEIQHYEFDGFSIDVLAVRAGPTMSEYLATRGYAIPDSSVFDPYVDQYVAIVESETRPPIDPTSYQIILDNYPELVPLLLAELENDPDRTADEMDKLKREVTDTSLVRHNRSLKQPVLELVDAIFGNTSFSGELLTIDLPLDEGKIFFPLGTSGGWPNEIGDIDVLFKVPEGKDLEIRDSRDAYFEGHHWYLFQMRNAAPDFDLESEVRSGDPDGKDDAERTATVYNNSRLIAFGITSALVIVLWLSVALLVIRWKGLDKKVLRDKRLWLLLGGALLLSLPGVLLVSLVLNPVPIEDLRGSFVVHDFMALYLVSAALLVVGVAWA
jgi:hypothetical protein